jgi:hypothetical protein
MGHVRFGSMTGIFHVYANSKGQFIQYEDVWPSLLYC